jgi:hypothetical protein
MKFSPSFIVVFAFPLLLLAAADDQIHVSPPRELAENLGVQDLEHMNNENGSTNQDSNLDQAATHLDRILTIKENQQQPKPLSEADEKVHKQKAMETNKRKKTHERRLKRHKTPHRHHHGITKADER